MKGVRARGDIMMISLCRRYSLFISMLIFLTAEISSAAEVRTTASQEWDSIVKRAEEEGQVAVYATDSIGNAQMIWAAFQKRYPKIKLVGTSLGRGSDLFPKLFGERRAGKFLADVFLGGAVFNLSQSLPGKDCRTNCAVTHPSGGHRSVQMVDGQAPLYRFRRSVRLYVRELFVRTSDSLQYQPYQRKRN